MSEQTAHTTTGASQALPLIVIDGAVVFPYTVASLPLDEQTAPAAEASYLRDVHLPPGGGDQPSPGFFVRFGLPRSGTAVPPIPPIG